MNISIIGGCSGEIVSRETVHLVLRYCGLEVFSNSPASFRLALESTSINRV